ncbi:hypothetical protein [Streptomyces sp. HF10]|uniref:hypothetical protein n=1 Tax=Streptomyces sp. HF10 TaxID=2692233 RepID=UPI001316B90C|nr:hypothetical protein [Streptomyces sp. HF10]QHC29905.1 hypothetical protein GR129_14830 [Streptomyces sp. HF10]
MIKVIRNATTVLVMLGLAGCGSTSAAESTAKSSPSASPSVDGPADAPEPTTTPDPIGGTLDGSWGAADSHSALVLDIRGHQAVLRGDGGRCEGTVAEEDDVPTVRLHCDYPRAKRTVGKVWGLTEKGMTVDWQGYGADSFRDIPSGSGS